MKRLAVCILLLASAARAQTPAVPTAASPAANAPAVGAPAANAPAATAPAANAPAAATAGKISVRVPSGGDYTVYIQEASAAPRTVQDKAELEAPAGAKLVTVYVLDPRSGYAARRQVDVRKPVPELTFASPDFKLLQKVRVQVNGKDDRPIAQGSVALSDGGKNIIRKIIQPASQGAAEFDFVASGTGSVTVTPEGGSATTKEVTLELAKGETRLVVPISLPEVTATVEPAAGTAPAANAPEANSPAANAPPVDANQPTAAPVQPAGPPAQPLPPPGGGIMGWISGFICTLLQFVVVIGLIVAALLFARSRGVTVETVMRKLGVQPDAVVQGGGTLAGANVGSGGMAPGPAPAPPPVVSDPNQCPFCGQMKDPSGGCACQVAPGSLSAGAPAAWGGGAAPGAGSGPRLVGMAGTYMGQVFPVAGAAVLGREVTNSVPLDRDTTASRRHAQITGDGGGFRIQDLGSSNGTFVNGARVTEAPLNPGDEVSIGGTRFRFEV